MDTFPACAVLRPANVVEANTVEEAPIKPHAYYSNPANPWPAPAVRQAPDTYDYASRTTLFTGQRQCIDALRPACLLMGLPWLPAVAWTYEERRRPVLRPLFSEGYGGEIMNRASRTNPQGKFIYTLVLHSSEFLMPRTTFLPRCLAITGPPLPF
jgi:hypothetical protein